jgi:magnesium-transporting ATPase (P-type)
MHTFTQTCTGETVPVIKPAIPGSNDRFSYNLHARHMLFSGTELCQIRGNALGLVVRTGYQSSKYGASSTALCALC